MSGSDCDGGEICRVGGRGGDGNAIEDADGPCNSHNEDEKKQQQVEEEMTTTRKARSNTKKMISKRQDFNNGETRKLGSGIGIGCCFPRNLAKAKQAVVVAKTKATEEKESRRPSSSSSSSPPSAGKCIGFRHCCYGYNKPPPILASQMPTSSSSLSTTGSDPNAPNFTSDMLRIFIQRNDFYCRECNPHSVCLTSNS